MSGKYPALTAREVVRVLRSNGFRLVRQAGSHQKWRHDNGRQAIVPMHASKTIPVELSRASSREVESSWRNSGNAAASENIGRVPHGATKLANMKLPPLSAIIEPGEDGWFVATCPELDIVTQGENHEHAVVMLKEAVELWLECGTPEEIAARIAERPPAR